MSASGHPIVATVMRLLTRRKDGGFDLGAPGAARLENELRKLLSDESLPGAIRELVVFADFIAKQHASPKTMAQLLTIAELAGPELRRRGKETGQLATEVRQRARQAKKKFFTPSGPAGSGLPPGEL